MMEGLQRNSGRPLQLREASSSWLGAFKYKGKNLRASMRKVCEPHPRKHMHLSNKYIAEDELSWVV
jgi:hypothetical protein